MIFALDPPQTGHSERQPPRCHCSPWTCDRSSSGTRRHQHRSASISNSDRAAIALASGHGFRLDPQPLLSGGERRLAHRAQAAALQAQALLDLLAAAGGSWSLPSAAAGAACGRPPTGRAPWPIPRATCGTPRTLRRRAPSGARRARRRGRLRRASSARFDALELHRDLRTLDPEVRHALQVARRGPTHDRLAISHLVGSNCHHFTPLR